MKARLLIATVVATFLGSLSLEARETVFFVGAHPDTGKKHKPYIRLRLSKGCTGKAWFDGVRLTEVGVAR